MPSVSRIPGLRRLPQLAGPIRRDVVLFDSWRGQFSDNPRAIAEELHRRGTGLRQVWVLDPALAGDVPRWIEPVAFRSTAHLAYLGRAGTFVANTTAVGFHHKRAGTTFLQTWHGTPLKKIGHHVTRSGSRADRQAERTLHHNVPTWDALLSPNRFSTPILRDAFGYEGPVLELGYPRNDLLLSPDAGEVRERTRARLGAEPGRRVVLYAPTFRDNAAFSLEADAQRMAERLGGGHLVLLRTHKTDAGQLTLGDDARFRDVSSHPDNRELFLAADVLVTDYSSLMFDFAVTRKPMVFYTPDLAEYRDRVRGFYFDFEAEAPGPLCATVDEVVAAFDDLDAVVSRARPAYDRFADRFCHLDDGRASERVVDDLLARAG